MVLKALKYNLVNLLQTGFREVLIRKFKLIYLYLGYLVEVFPAYLVKVLVDYLELELLIRANKVVDVLTILKKTTWGLFNSLSDLICIDYPGRIYRFILVYHLLNIKYNYRLRVKLGVPTLASSLSTVFVFPSASWAEREVWDLFGVFFDNHLDLRRILTDYGFDGHPLRKDFPLSGFYELFYDDTRKVIVYEPISLAQAFRTFKFNNPWVK